MLNPHTVVELADESALRGCFAHCRRLPSFRPPRVPSYDPAPPRHELLELVVDRTQAGANWGNIAMRVLERGVGETRQVRAAPDAARLLVATAPAQGPAPPAQWVVDISEVR